MAYKIGTKTFPARLVADVDGEEVEVASFDLEVPYTATLGDAFTGTDGRKYAVVDIAPIDDRALTEAVRHAFRCGAVRAP